VYAGASPLNATDPTGHFLETVADGVAIGMDWHDIQEEGLNWGNGIALGLDVVGAAIPFVPSVVGHVRRAGKALAHADEGRVLLDSSVITKLAQDPTLGGRLAAGERTMVSYVTRPELRNAVARGRGLRGVPRVLDTLPVLTSRPSIDLVINVRGALKRKTGSFGDGIIGAQAIEFRLPLITDDNELAAVVRSMGGTVR
jgi:predicted nucleic acid-binding protein